MVFLAAAEDDIIFMVLVHPAPPKNKTNKKKIDRPQRPSPEA